MTRIFRSFPERLAASLVCLLVTPLAWSCSIAQLTAADYARAERFLSWNKDEYIADGEVRPRWIEGQDRFWYRRTIGAGAAQFIVVDAATGARAPAFDHERLAVSLSKVLGKAIDAGAFPFRSFRFAAQGRAIEFLIGDEFWSCRLDRDDCRRAAAPTQLDRSSVVSPDGKWAVFRKDHNLWVRATDGSSEFALTTDGVEHYDYAGSTGNSTHPLSALRSRVPPAPVVSWSPDSRKILTHRVDERQVEKLHLLQSAPEDASVRPKLFSFRFSMPHDEHKALVEQIVFDVATRQHVALGFPVWPSPYQTPIEVRDAWWSEDGSEVLYIERGPYYRSLKLHVADAATGKARTLLEESGKSFIELNDVDHYPMVRRLSNGNVLWFSERDGWGHLYVYDRSGHALQITRGEWLVRGIIGVDELSGTVYFTAAGREPGRNPYFRHLYRVNLNGSNLNLLTPEDADHQIYIHGDDFVSAPDLLGGEEPLGLSPSGKYFVDVYSRPDQPAVSVLRASDGRLIATLEKADISALTREGFTMPEPFEVLAADGKTTLYGTLLKPSHFDPAKKYPVLDSIYPGPQITRVPQSFSSTVFSWTGASALAELGFIVVTVDGRGTPLRSKAFLSQSYGKLGTAGNLEDHIATVRQLADRFPWIDLDRVGIFGSSAGGYASTHAILQYPAFYKVAVSAAGNHDQRGYLSIWGETYNGPDDGRNYLEAANAPLAKNLRGKLLLMQGEMDDNVNPALTLQLVDALIKANKDFDLLIVPNAGHGVMGSGYTIRRQWDFFVRHLLGAEPPAGYQIGMAPRGGD